MDYLLISSVALLLGSFLTALILRLPVQIRQPFSAGRGRRTCAPLSGSSRQAWQILPGTSSRVRRSAPVNPGPDVVPPAVFTRREPAPVECRGDSATGDAPAASPKEVHSVLDQGPPAVP